MRRALLISLLTIVAALAAVATALAAWSAPQTISTPHTFAGDLHVLNQQAGDSLVWWTWQQGTGQTAPGGTVFVTRQENVVSHEHTLPAGTLALETYAQSRLIALAEQGDSLRVAFGTATGVGSPRTIVTGALRYRPALAVAGDGSADVVWIQAASHNRRLVEISTRAAGGSFIKPGVLSGVGRADAVAVGHSRKVTAVAYARDGRLIARVRRAGHNWSSPQDLGAAALGTQNDIAVAATDGGAVAVVWRHRHLTEGGSAGPSILDAASLSATAGRFSATRQVEADGASAPSIEVSGERVALAYAEQVGGRPVPRLRILAPAPGPPIDLAPAAGGQTDVTLAQGDRNGFAVSWEIPQPGDDSTGIGFAGGIDAAGDVLAPQQVTPDENVSQIALLDADAGPEAFWVARPGGTGPFIPIAKLQTLVRFSAPAAP